MKNVYVITPVAQLFSILLSLFFIISQNPSKIHASIAWYIRKSPGTNRKQVNYDARGRPELHARKTSVRAPVCLCIDACVFFPIHVCMLVKFADKAEHIYANIWPFPRHVSLSVSSFACFQSFPREHIANKTCRYYATDANQSDCLCVCANYKIQYLTYNSV